MEAGCQGLQENLAAGSALLAGDGLCPNYPAAQATTATRPAGDTAARPPLSAASQAEPGRSWRTQALREALPVFLLPGELNSTHVSLLFFLTIENTLKIGEVISLLF